MALVTCLAIPQITQRYNQSIDIWRRYTNSAPIYVLLTCIDTQTIILAGLTAYRPTCSQSAVGQFAQCIVCNSFIADKKLVTRLHSEPLHDSYKCMNANEEGGWKKRKNWCPIGDPNGIMKNESFCTAWSNLLERNRSSVTLYSMKVEDDKHHSMGRMTEESRSAVCVTQSDFWPISSWQRHNKLVLYKQT